LRGLGTPHEAILRQLEIAGHNLLVMGVSPRPGDQLFFGPVAAEILGRAKCSVLFLASEPSAPAAPPRISSANQSGPARGGDAATNVGRPRSAHQIANFI
jgi:hypothetical protein